MNKAIQSPLVMGILNLTPDSFSDGGRYQSLDLAVSRVREIVEEGADLLDIGAESTRPGAKQIGTQEELDRICPVIEKIQSEFNIPISIDTRRTEVMKAVLSNFQVHMINDVNALTDSGALELLSSYPDVLICLMHHRGQPSNMQNLTNYPSGVVPEVIDFLKSKILLCQEAGINKSRLILDVGIGFAKTTEQNLELIRFHSLIKESLKQPMLLGFSRKSFLGEICNEPNSSKRLGASIALSTLSFSRGADIIRVHDVKETVQAIAVWKSLNQSTPRDVWTRCTIRS